MQVKLIVRGGKNDGREVAIKIPQFVVGRAEGCHLRPRSDTISRKHCVLEITDKGLTIRDLKSRNGVVVNGEHITKRTLLRTGDMLNIGSLQFEVMIDHSLGGSKKPKVKDVKEAAVRSAGKKTGLEEDDVASWLDEADEIDRTRQLADPDTRQFKLDETERIILKKASEEAAAKAEQEQDKPEAPEKKAPQKLPEGLKGQQSKDSREAAQDMLKKFFNRR